LEKIGIGALLLKNSMGKRDQLIDRIDSIHGDENHILGKAQKGMVQRRVLGWK